jgi:hypothetical protein
VSNIRPAEQLCEGDKPHAVLPSFRQQAATPAQQLHTDTGADA